MRKATIGKGAASASILAMTLALATPAAAQTGADTDGEEQDAALEENEAAERSNNNVIVVTAQKREENLQEVGLTVTALGEGALRERNIQSLADIAAAVPGLSYINSANNTPVYNLRGVGFYDTSLGSYPTTSVYLDQVPLPFPVLTNLTAFDLQRIEVLKGPQGTLFGQNSTGGAINYIANRPTDIFEAGIEASYGRFNHFVGSGYVSGPLADGLSARLAFRGEGSGPWQYSYTRDDENGRLENYAARLLVDWEPSDTLSFQLNLNGWLDKNEPQAVQYFAFNQQAITNVLPPVRNYPFVPDDSPRAADWSVENGMYRDLEFWQAALRGDWEFADGITLTSITSYIDFNQDGALDQDGINFQDIDLRFFYGDIQSFSQELRIANDDFSRFRWIIGANYSHDEVFYRENLVYGDGSGGNNQAPPNQIESSENFSDQVMDNYALFASADWDVTDDLTLKAGLRYTRAERTADICNLDGTLTPMGGPARRNFPVGGANRLFDFLADVFAPGNTYPDIGVIDDCFNLNDPDPQNVNENNLGPYQPGLFTASLNEDNISWRVGLDYNVNPDLLLYANVARGYKAGGFGNINAAIDFQFRPAVQESITNYEVGFKSTLADGMMTFNGAAFYMDYQDKQLRTKDINPIFGIIDALNNVPESHILGFELDANVTPGPGWNFGAAFTYLSSEIDTYSGISAAGVVADFAGTVIPFTPEYQIGVNGRYEWDISTNVSAFVAGQLTYSSETWAAIGGHPDATLDLAPDFNMTDYLLVDAQVGIRSEDGWRVMLWGKNLTSEYYWTNVVAGQDQIVRYAQRPAEYGITVGFDF